VREIERLDKGLRESPEFVTEKLALRDWCRLTGPRAMSMELLRFLRDEVALRGKAELVRWQETLTRLFNRDLRSGPPVEVFDSKSVRQIEQKARNAEEALLAALNACARVSGIVTKVAWTDIEAGTGDVRAEAVPGTLTANNLIHRLRGQRWPPDVCVALQCLGWLDWTRVNLVLNDLYMGDLAHSVLAEASLIKAELGDANLHEANLHRAECWDADLIGADLTGADLTGANLSGANLSRANLNRATLNGANLKGARLQGANLEGADLSAAEGLSQKQLNQAWGDEHTKLPKGLSIRKQPRTRESVPLSHRRRRLAAEPEETRLVS
jgi:hypothetical protein